MWELEAWVTAMAWDWDADDIDGDDEDRNLWVPMMAQTLNMGTAKWYRGLPHPEPAMPPRQMTVYTVQLNQDGSAEQASTLVLMPVQMPQMTGCVVIKVNQGQGESPMEEEMTADEDGEREVSEPRGPSEAPAMPHDKVKRLRAKCKEWDKPMSPNRQKLSYWLR